MTPEFVPTREIKVILADMERDGGSACLVYRTGTIFWRKVLGLEPEVRFRPPEDATITIEQMEAILEMMRKFKADEDPKPN